jgi:hypothetical protein
MPFPLRKRSSTLVGFYQDRNAPVLNALVCSGSGLRAPVEAID